MQVNWDSGLEYSVDSDLSASRSLLICDLVSLAMAAETHGSALLNELAALLQQAFTRSVLDLSVTACQQRLNAAATDSSAAEVETEILLQLASGAPELNVTKVGRLQRACSSPALSMQMRRNLQEQICRSQTVH